MKRTYSPLICLSLLAISITSCTKQYTCDCHLDNGSSRTEIAPEVFTDKEDNARQRCDDYRDELQSGVSVIGGTVTCDFMQK